MTPSRPLRRDGVAHNARPDQEGTLLPNPQQQLTDSSLLEVTTGRDERAHILNVCHHR